MTKRRKKQERCPVLPQNAADQDSDSDDSAVDADEFFNKIKQVKQTYESKARTMTTPDEEINDDNDNDSSDIDDTDNGVSDIDNDIDDSDDELDKSDENEGQINQQDLTSDSDDESETNDSDKETDSGSENDHTDSDNNSDTSRNEPIDEDTSKKKREKDTGTNKQTYASNVDKDESDTAEFNEDEELASIKAELSHMPFEELQQLKEKLGVKLYNQAIFGTTASGRPSGSKNKVFKRANKNRPMEISSKRKPKRLREVIEVKKKVHRDPRFDDLSGEYNEDLFKQSYGFIDDVKAREMKRLKKSMKVEADPEKKEKLKYLLDRKVQQDHTEKQKTKRKDADRVLKKQERGLIKQGKTPFYLKSADKKKLELAEKYKELKKSGKLEAYLGKKRKKNAQKERKKLPFRQDMD
ncbi:unnamed protein product [Owenia fusiformis]|uniref:rRNA biogenesis protein RRP36 n=1 Tax=Owenia fusiformis TaxID=6347 RepID=A0A8J1U2J3_OWEFU|nr:unnamed protein product [Owenia fusiformis]